MTLGMYVPQGIWPAVNYTIDHVLCAKLRCALQDYFSSHKYNPQLQALKKYIWSLTRYEDKEIELAFKNIFPA